MASRRMGDRPVDLGASYFTVDAGAAFEAVVDDWRARGLAGAWTDRFTVLGQGSPQDKQGPVRMRAAAGLRSLVEDHLGSIAGLEVEQREVERVQRSGRGWLVDDEPARAVVLAMPDPQARRLLPDADPLRSRLDRQWAAILAVTVRAARRTWDGASPSGRFEAAFVNDHDVLSFVADDGRRRGDDQPVLVAHTTPEFAAGHLEDPGAAAPAVLDALRGVLDLPDDVETHVHRWTFARPTGERRAAYLWEEGLGVCGDGWGESPKVETAWSSGDALGRRMAAVLADG